MTVYIYQGGDVRSTDHKVADVKKFFKKGGHLSEAGTALYVDALKLGKVSALPVRMLDHVASCHKCKRDITGLYAMLISEDYSGLGGHPSLDLAAVNERNQGAVLLRVAAMIFALLTLGAAVYFVGNLGRKQYMSDTSLQPGHTPDSDLHLDSLGSKRFKKFHPHPESLAARYSVSPNLEGAAGATFRSTSTEVLSPVPGEVPDAPIDFRWQTEDKPPFTLIIMDNRERVIKEVHLKRSEYHLQKILPEGLYYWKLVSGKDLLLISKFVVRHR